MAYTKHERAVIEANARKPYADEIVRLNNRLNRAYDALELLLRKIGRGSSDFSGWHGASAADIGEILAAARYALADKSTERKT